MRTKNGTYTLLLLGRLRSSKEKDSTDPMWHKYPHLISYNYCSNNPVMRVDPDGRADMKYINNKGETLYETKDGLKDIIIIPQNNIQTLENKLNASYANGTINNPEVNKQEMHPLGKTSVEYTNKVTKGKSENWVIGYTKTYQRSYKERKGVFKDSFSLSQIISSFITAIADEYGDNSARELHNGQISGIQDGNNDKSAGRINRVEPTSNLKKQ